MKTGKSQFIISSRVGRAFGGIDDAMPKKEWSRDLVVELAWVGSLHAVPSLALPEHSNGSCLLVELRKL